MEPSRQRLVGKGDLQSQILNLEKRCLRDREMQSRAGEALIFGFGAALQSIQRTAVSTRGGISSFGAELATSPNARSVLIAGTFVAFGFGSQ